MSLTDRSLSARILASLGVLAVSAIAFYLVYTGERLVKPRAPTLDRRTRSITLPNGLRAYLISDPATTQSSAAMSVGVGSLADPPEHQGLAHFLEHMLFLGTRRYPDPTGFDRFLAEYNGSSNAYTDSENTTYFYSVSHTGAAEALDRFARFFIDPLLDPQYVQKEVRAVDAEHQRARENDTWRLSRVHEWLARPDHPLHQHGAGSAETLKQVNPEVLRSFHERYYHSSLMRLVVQGQASLDEAEAWVRTSFEHVPLGDAPTPQVDPSPHSHLARPLWVTVRPKSAVHRLRLVFETPSALSYLRQHPAMILRRVLGRDGVDSLSEQLRAAGAIQSLGVWSQSYAFGGELVLDLDLTEQGAERPEVWIEKVFAYINELKKHGIARHVFDELKSMNQWRFDLRSAGGNEDDAATLAYQLLYSDPETMEYEWAVPQEFGAEVYDRFLASLDPERMIVYQTDPRPETWQGANPSEREPHYEAEFRRRAVSERTLEAWRRAGGVGPNAISPKNAWIPKDMRVRKYGGGQGSLVRVHKDAFGEIWHHPVTRFVLPTGRLQIELTLPSGQRDARANVLHKLWLRMWNRAEASRIADWDFAGLSVHCDERTGGLDLTIDGYSEHLLRVAEESLRSLANPRALRAFFEIEYPELVRDLKNQKFATPTDQIGRRIRWAATSPGPSPDELLDAVEGLSLEDFLRWSDDLTADFRYRVLVYGNIERRKGIKLAKTLPKLLGAKTAVLEESELVRHDRAWPAGQPLEWNFTSDSDNHAYGEVVPCTSLAPDSRDFAGLKLADQFLGEHFFRVLRTEQQLGYVAKAAVQSGIRKQANLVLILMSKTHSAPELASRVSAWKEQALADGKAQSPELFETMKASAVADLRQDAPTPGEWIDQLTRALETYDGDTAYRERLAQTLEGLTQQDWIATLETCLLSTAVPRFVILHHARGSMPADTSNPIVAGAKRLVRLEDLAEARE